MRIKLILMPLVVTFLATAVWALTDSGGDARNRLVAGNERYVEGKPVHPHLTETRRERTATEGQQPFATVIACSDSRVPIELLFDQGIGDLFVIRVAGNVCDTSVLASAEYGAAHLKTPLMVVLGHSQCGAVSAAVQDAKVHGALPDLLAMIKPAVQRTRADHPDLKGDGLIAATIKSNAWKTVEDLLTKSEDIRKLVSSGDLSLVVAVYDIHTGSIEWLGEHPQQAELLKRGNQGHTGHGGHGDHDSHADHDREEAEPAAAGAAEHGSHSD